VPAKKSAMSAMMPTAENVPATAAVLCRKLWRRGNQVGQMVGERSTHGTAAWDGVAVLAGSELPADGAYVPVATTTLVTVVSCPFDMVVCRDVCVAKTTEGVVDVPGTVVLTPAGVVAEVLVVVDVGVDEVEVLVLLVEVVDVEVVLVVLVLVLVVLVLVLVLVGVVEVEVVVSVVDVLVGVVEVEDVVDVEVVLVSEVLVLVSLVVVSAGAVVDVDVLQIDCQCIHKRSW
jgi:hypothetical protein